jgi:hypothetical protein
MRISAQWTSVLVTNLVTTPITAAPRFARQTTTSIRRSLNNRLKIHPKNRARFLNSCNSSRNTNKNNVGGSGNRDSVATGRATMRIGQQIAGCHEQEELGDHSKKLRELCVDEAESSSSISPRTCAGESAGRKTGSFFSAYSPRVTSRIAFKPSIRSWMMMPMAAPKPVRHEIKLAARNRSFVNNAMRNQPTPGFREAASDSTCVTIAVGKRMSPDC